MKEENDTNRYVPPLNPEKQKYFQNGEIITAERLNRLIDAIESLEERVKELEKKP